MSRLGQGTDLTVSELARLLPIKLPAVMKHLDVLASAGLVERRKSGRTVTVRLLPRPMEEAVSWLNRYECFWNDRLDGLVALAEELERKKK